MATTLRDFITVWQELSREEKEKVYRFLLEAYGKKELLSYLYSVKTSDELLKENILKCNL